MLKQAARSLSLFLCYLSRFCCFPASRGSNIFCFRCSFTLYLILFIRTKKTQKSQLNGNGTKSGGPSTPSAALDGSAAAAAASPPPNPPSPAPSPPPSPQPRPLKPPPQLQLQPPLAFGAVVRRVARAVASRPADAAAWLERVLAEAEKSGSPILLPHVVRDALASVEAEVAAAAENGKGEPFHGDAAAALALCQGGVACGSCVGLALRPAVGVWAFVRVCARSLRVEELPVSAYLAMKECAVGTRLSRRERLLGMLEVDLAPFAHGLPRVSRAKAIGDGLRHLNRHLTSKVLSVAASRRASIAVQDGGGGEGFPGDDEDDDGFPRRSSSTAAAASAASPPPSSSALVAFLRDLEIDGLRIMLGDRSPTDEDSLAALLARAEAFLARQDPEAPAGPGSAVADALSRMGGFEPGWGATAGRALETMEQLSEILDAPAADVVESFLGKETLFFFVFFFPVLTKRSSEKSHGREKTERFTPTKKLKITARIPLVTKVVSVSVHGYFAQSNALGKPDSGGQIVYVLDSVRALEKELNERIEAALGSAPPPPAESSSAAAEAAAATAARPPHPQHPRARVLILTRLIPDALDTSCDARLERVAGTEAAAILRVPFRSSASGRSGGESGSGDGVGGERGGQEIKILRKFVSRFQVWPFLEDFALDAAPEILRELGGSPPDLILGNYSDGNLVATLLSRRLADDGGKDDGDGDGKDGDGDGKEKERKSERRPRRRRFHGPTQCSIAHALESNKYRDSLARWREYGTRYNFETMFTSVRKEKRESFFLFWFVLFFSPSKGSMRSTKRQKKCFTSLFLSSCSLLKQQLRT